jgi:hypothetical protein
MTWPGEARGRETRKEKVRAIGMKGEPDNGVGIKVYCI